MLNHAGAIAGRPGSSEAEDDPACRPAVDGFRQPKRIAVAVVERAGGYLVGRRPEGVPLDGLWEFPGGKVKAAETPEEAAVRECQEEAEIAIRVKWLYDIIDYDYEHAALRLYFFACEAIGPAKEPKPPFQWLAAAELAGLKFPPANAAILRRLKLGL